MRGTIRATLGDISKIQKEVEEVLDEGGSIYTEDLSYEEGILATIAWLLGETNSPMEEPLLEAPAFQ